MRNRFRILAATGLVAASLVGVVGAASAASANADTAPSSVVQTNSVIKTNTSSYTSPSNQSTTVHNLKAGEDVQAFCKIEATELHGNYYWFRITKDGKFGYVHRDAISAPLDLPSCDRG